MVITTLLATAIAQDALKDVRLIRWPAIHGDKYVFTYASDLWIADINGGHARRLTSHPGLEQQPHFSPDGKWIAFTGQYDGGNDVYVIPAEGGSPTRLTYEPSSEQAKGWTPDGRVAYVSSAGNHTNRMPRLWFVSREGGLPQSTPLQEVFDLSFSPDGKRMAFNRSTSHTYNWRRYRGGTQGRISFWDFDTNTYSELETGREQNYFPLWVGDKVFYVSDKNQSNLNLYSYDTKSKRVTQVTKFTDGDVRWPSTDGKKIIFERNLRVHTMDIASGQITTLDPQIVTDQLPMRERYANVADQMTSFALSPSGARVVVEARGEMFSVPASNGSTRNISDTVGAREQTPTWSHDGQHIYFLSDRSGEQRLYKRPQMEGEPTEVRGIPSTDRITGYELAPKGGKIAYTTFDWKLKILDEATGTVTDVYQDQGASPNFEWSPDGAWIVFTETQPNLQSAVRLYNVADKKTTAVTSGYYSDSNPTFDLSGKYLYLTSGRTFGPQISAFEIGLFQSDVQRVYVLPLSASTPSPLEAPEDEEPVTPPANDQGQTQEQPAQPAPPAVDLTDMEARMVPLPMGPGSYPFITGVNNGVLFVGADGTLQQFSFANRQAAPIMPAIQQIAFNPGKTKMAYVAAGQFGIADVRPGQQPGVGRVNLADVVMKIDPAAEYRQMFWEGWRFQRDQFYDANMLGLNWKAIGDKYAAMLPYVGDRSDLDYIFGQLIGELGTGHAYITPGPVGGMPLSPPSAFLGADYNSVGDKVQFKKIYRGLNSEPGQGGPLGALGVSVKEGDFLLAIDGEPVTVKTGVAQLLIGKGNKRVTLTVNSSPTMTGAREVQVRPITSETNLRYRTWVEERRALVDKLSNGRIGYMHVPDTSVGGIIGFTRGFWSQTEKEAWVIDERYNGGGWIPTFFIEYLSRSYNNVIAPRHGRDIPLPMALNGPKAMLINEHAGSGGDLFPYLFKKSGLGPLIGRRTWGGLVGIQGEHTFIDGGGMTSPAFGIYDPQTGEWIAENTGVDPDIDIDDRPDLAAKGQDVQLERAVQYLMNELRNTKPLQGTPRYPVPPTP